MKDEDILLLFLALMSEEAFQEFLTMYKTNDEIAFAKVVKDNRELIFNRFQQLEGKVV